MSESSATIVVEGEVVSSGRRSKESSPPMSSPPMSSPPLSSSKANKSNVRELKRLFESKKTVVFDKLSSLTSNRFKSSTTKEKETKKEREKDNKLKEKEKVKEKERERERDKERDNIKQQIQLQSPQLQQPFTNDKPDIKVLEVKDKDVKIEYEEIQISSSERKYYYYINEAIRKNIPIVPSLAIRRKSLDLTHSPIKGSLYASKYQHNYSPSTRTITLSKNQKKSVTVPPPQFNDDTSWIKSAMDDESVPDSSKKTLSIAPSEPIAPIRPSLIQSKSTFELKPPIFRHLSQEEPTPKKSLFSKDKELRIKLKKDKVKDRFQDDNNNNYKDNKQKESKDDIINLKEKADAKDKVFSWATLRRMKRSASTVEDTPVFIISPPLKSTPGTSTTTSAANYKPLSTSPLATVSADNIPTKHRDDSTISDKDKVLSASTPTSPTQEHPPQRKHGSSLELSTSKPPQPLPSTGSPPNEVKRYVSQSITILRKDMVGSNSFSSPSSPSELTPPKPTKFISIAKRLHSTAEELKVSSATLESSAAVSESEPSSPVLSPSRAEIITASGTVSNPRLEALLQTTRTRSSSVGSLHESTKFEVVEIPPLKVHVSSLEECLEQFAKPFEGIGGGRCFVLDLANCSLGDDGLREISSNCPGNLEIADLSWNEISGDGLEVFTRMLVDTQSLFTSLSLQGNAISPTNLQAFLESISQITHQKKGYTGFGLNLKETGIENEGAEYLANYIGSNQTPHMIGLNLTYASVTDMGMSYFSSALVRNTFLTTLILDENYLGDDGACLLAEGLKFNKSLTHLQMRNAGVGESGVIELSNACKFNTTIALLDLSLNPWELNGEMALQSLITSKQMMSKKQKIVITKALWKDEGMSQWEAEEVEQIIQHFTKEKIIDLLINGFSLSPLIQQEQLFEHFKLETSHLSKIFKQIVEVNPNQSDNSSYALKLLVDILPTHLENHDFLSSFLNHLPLLVSILDRSFKKIDLFFLKLLEFFDLLIQSDNVQCFEKLNDCNIFNKCLDLIYEFPYKNILHQKVLNLFVSTTKNAIFNKFEQSVFSIEHLGRLISYITMESDSLPGNRSPNFGHLLEISKLVKISTHPFLNTKEWKQYQANVLEKETQLQDNYLCGFVPDRNMKLDKSLLDKFEKEFKVGSK